MKLKRNINKACGLTLREVLVVIFVVVVLFTPAFVGRPKDRRNAERIACVNKLKQVGLAYRLWSGDARDHYPMMNSTNHGGSQEYADKGSVFETFRCMSNELNTPIVLVCPADSRKPALSFATLGNSNISYFIGLDADETMPQMLLSGDRNLATNGVVVSPGLVTIRSNDVVSWTKELHDGQGNVGMADGSVQKVSSAMLQQLLRSTGTTTNRLVVP